MSIIIRDPMRLQFRALNRNIVKSNIISDSRPFVTSARFETRQQKTDSTTNRKDTSNPNLKVFEDNATKWWTGKEFSILRSMNELRVPFIQNGLHKPIEQCKLIDVGCGGGILSEPLARLGANVLGIDPVFESINQAQLHAASQQEQDLLSRLTYRNCNIEDLSAQAEHVEAFDGLIASEVLEHIEDVEQFLVHCNKLLRPNGSLFITTINQTPLSWLGVIFFGEYVLKQLPKGTHQYDMFVNVKGLRVMLERLGYHIRLINGFMYEPISGNFYWTPTTLTHYALQAVKTTGSTKNINYQQKRYAKRKAAPVSRPKNPLDDDEMLTVIPIDVFRKKCQLMIDEWRQELDMKFSIRANTSAYETIKVRLDGLSESLELKDIAQISMKGNNMIVINLSTMPEAVKATMKALQEFGANQAQVDVNNIFVPVPRVTYEHRERLAADAKAGANKAKERLRALFSEYSSLAKRQQKSGVSIDLIRNTVENIQFETNKLIGEVDSMLREKTERLLNQNH